MFFKYLSWGFSVLLTVMLLSSCLFKSSKTTPSEAFHQKHYALAIELYTESGIEKGDHYARDAYRLAKSYEAVMNYELALIWYKKAYNSRKESKYAYAVGVSLMRLSKYDLAIKAFDQYLLDFPFDIKVERKIKMCKQAKKWLVNQDVSPYKVSITSFNTPASDYSPAFKGEDIYFSSDRMESNGNEIYGWTGNDYSDIFVKTRNGSIVPTDIGVNSEENEGAICFGKKENVLYFTRCDIDAGGVSYCKLMYSEKVEGYWEEPKYLKFFDENVNEVHPCLLESDSVLVFVANPETSQGGYDLYYAVKEKNGWSAAEPMPTYLNTIGDEKFPTAHEDTLYFSSDYLLGMGGLDIFKTYLKPDYKWSIPTNLEAPINSSFDDFSLVVDPNFVSNIVAVQAGLFSSNRISGIGRDDIYRFIKTKLSKDTLQEEKEDEIFNVFILLKVIDDNNIPLSDVDLLINSDVQKATDKKGKYFFTPLKNNTYNILLKKDNYLSNSTIIDLKEDFYNQLSGDTTININIVLNELHTGKEIVLENIYYDFDKYELREESKTSLLTLVKLLNDNPNINIELGAHTDCKGEEEYNNILSQKRAQSVVRFLIEKGITRSRLIAKGYGELHPIDDCNCDDCSEESRQKNRRTSFKIL